MKTFLRQSGLFALLATLFVASTSLADVVSKPGRLIVQDGGKLFTEEGIRKAQDEFARLQSKTGREVWIETLPELPKAEKAKYDALDPKVAGAQHRFFVEFAKAEAKEDRAKGVYILICKSPGHIAIIVDQEMRTKGFSASKEDDLARQLTKDLREAKAQEKPEDQAAGRNKALFSAVEYLERELPAAASDVKTTTKPQAAGDTPPAEKKGSNIMSYVCIGIVALLGIWMVVALIRMFTGGGSGGGGGMGGGGGGTGFFGGLMGGLFGAVAGMWMYDQFFGHHGSNAYAGDGGAANGTQGVDDTGSGNFDNDNGAGGSFDNGGGGGGDFGGGDLGGGSDF